MVHCPKCQAENEDSAKFCTKCGAELAASTAPATSTDNTSTADTTSAAAPVAVAAAPAQQESATTPAASAPQSTETAIKPAEKAPNFFSFIISAMIKPISTFREHLNKFSDFKNAAIITLISAVFAMLCGLLVAMFRAVIVQRCSFFGSSCKTSIEFENLGDLDWLNLILVNFIVYVAVIALLAGIYFGLSRAFKRKETNFCRMMTIVAVAIVPMMIATLVGGLVAMLNATLGGLVVSAGSVYGFYMLYEGLNNEAGITGDKKVYYNFLSVFILLVVVAVLVLILNEGTGDLGAGAKMLDLF